MNNSSAPCSFPDVETQVQIPVTLSLLGGMDMIETDFSYAKSYFSS